MNRSPTKLRARTGASQKCQGLAFASTTGVAAACAGPARTTSSRTDRRAARAAFTEVSIRGCVSVAPSYRRAVARPDAKASDRRVGGQFVPDRLGHPAPQVARDFVTALLGDQDPQLHLEVVAPRTGG